MRHFQHPRLEIEISTYFSEKMCALFASDGLKWRELHVHMRMAVQNISHVVTELEYVPARLVYHSQSITWVKFSRQLRLWRELSTEENGERLNLLCVKHWTKSKWDITSFL